MIFNVNEVEGAGPLFHVKQTCKPWAVSWRAFENECVSLAAARMLAVLYLHEERITRDKLMLLTTCDLGTVSHAPDAGTENSVKELCPTPSNLKMKF